MMKVIQLPNRFFAKTLAMTGTRNRVIIIETNSIRFLLKA